MSLPPPSVLRHVVDVHCHPTDSTVRDEDVERLPITVCAMSSRMNDQPLVRSLALAHPSKIIPCFGYHPWFSHWISLKAVESKEDHYRQLLQPSEEQQTMFQTLISTLPDPTPLDDILHELQQNFEDFPEAMLGEVGLDRSFRIPEDYFASPRVLTEFTVPFSHQLIILEAQLDLAVEMQRNVSLHSVKAQANTQTLLNDMAKKHSSSWTNISIDLHSCGLSSQTWLDIEKRHTNVFFSLSTVINERSPNFKRLIEACSPARILVESDFNDINHSAQRTWDMIQYVAEIKKWSIETDWDDAVDKEDDTSWGVVRRLERNWIIFKRGKHSPPVPKERKKGK